MFDKQNVRLFFLVIMLIIAGSLYNNWLLSSKDIVDQKISNSSDPINLNNLVEDSLPIAPVVNLSEPLAAVTQNTLVSVKTPEFNINIDLLGGSITHLELNKYKAKLNQDNGFALLQQSSERYYIAESGLLSEHGPDKQGSARAVFSCEKNEYISPQDNIPFSVNLHYTTDSGVKIIKRFVFSPGSYLIDVVYEIENTSDVEYKASLFGRIKRQPAIEKSTGIMGGMRTFTGAAFTTPDTRYKKISLSDFAKKPFKETISGGWVAMVEHYFTSAWIPDKSQKHYYQTDVFADNKFGARFISPLLTVEPGKKAITSAKLYVGPGITQELEKISPNLALTVDYGVLWFISQPLFFAMKYIHELTGNWGVAIILITVMIKCLFFKLSASSYRSMGKMRQIQPKIDELKARYGDDRQGFGLAMMELYKKEKINPLGGCMPILVQIPVFFALYYVLLESVELRHAALGGWISDLSSKDPYFVLPVIMGISMYLQQRLNPSPPDPLQAKVMMVMPVFFTFLFLQFPSGLVLYWVVNNLLSVLQQWFITRGIEKSATTNNYSSNRNSSR